MFVYYALLVSGSIGGKVIILVWVRVDVNSIFWRVIPDIIKY